MSNAFAHPDVEDKHELATISFSYQLQIPPIAHRFLDLRNKKEQWQQHQCRPP